MFSVTYLDSTAAYLESFPGSNLSRPHSTSALSLRQELLSPSAHSPMSTPTDLQYPQDRLHLPMFSDSLIFSNYLAEEPEETHDHEQDYHEQDDHQHYTSSSSSSSLLPHSSDDLPASFTEMRHGLFSPAMSDVTPLLGSLDSFPSASLTDSFGPWDSGDFGDFDDLDDPYDGGLALFGGVAIDEGVDQESDLGLHNISGSITGVALNNHDPITPRTTPRNSPCMSSELHSPPTSPTANKSVRSPPSVATEA